MPAWSPNAYSAFAVLAAGISVLIAAQAWHERDDPGARPFAALALTLGAWSLVYGVQLGFPTLDAQRPWQLATFAIGGVVPTAWLLFALRYAGVMDRVPRWLRRFMLVDPVVFAGVTLTNPLHGLVLAGATFPAATPRVIAPTFGIVYLVHIVYAYAAVATGIALLVVVLLRSSPLYNRQTGLLLLGGVPPFLTHITYTLHVPLGPSPGLDLTPFVFAFTGILFGLALYRFDLLERVPLARRRVLDGMGDGLVVLDRDGTVVDVNRVGRAAFDPTPGIGSSVRALAAGDTATVDDALDALDGTTLAATVHGRTRAYDVEVSPLRDHRDAVAGHVLALRDVTDRNEYEQRLEVTQRVLRHNLRNEINVIQGLAEQLELTASEGEAEMAARIIDRAEALIDLSEKTRAITRMTDTRGVVDVGDVLADLVSAARDRYPAAEIEFDPPSGVEAVLPGESALEVAVSNLLENAIEHNDRAAPWVRVRVVRSTDHVRIVLEDDGPEIPAVEREVLREGSEDPLRHGSGVGLWLAYWSVTTVGGSLSFDPRSPRGNQVTVTVPRGAAASASGRYAGLAADD